MAGEFVTQLQPGMKVGKYQIVSLVATGGMAMVYKAYDKSLDRYVAIKQIAPNLAAEGIAVHTICPGITETGVLGDRRQLVERIGVPVMEPDAVAAAALTAAAAPLDDTGTCWVVQHGKPPWPMTFADVPTADQRLNIPVPPAHSP